METGLTALTHLEGLSGYLETSGDAQVRQNTRHLSYSLITRPVILNTHLESLTDSPCHLFHVEGEGLHVSYVIGGVLTILAILILIAALIIYRWVSFPPQLQFKLNMHSVEKQHIVQIKSK